MIKVYTLKNAITGTRELANTHEHSTIIVQGGRHGQEFWLSFASDGQLQVRTVRGGIVVRPSSGNTIHVSEES